MTADRLADLDFVAHNERTQARWDAFGAGEPVVPCILGTNTRYFLFDQDANAEAVSFGRYIDDPDVMFETGLKFARWSKFNLLQDAELGIPDTWYVGVDFQNYREAAWLGCPVITLDGEVPDTLPAYTDGPGPLLDQGLPDPFGGIMGRLREFQEHFEDRARRETYLDRPIKIHYAGPALGTDGPFTVACNVCGPEWICAALLDEPDEAQALLTFLTDAIIARIQAWRPLFGLPERYDGFWLADDSVALISGETYREHVLPHHRRIYDTLGTEKGRGMHLCGNATRHFRTLVDECKVTAFDTGFPVDFGALRAELGPDVLIQGGPHVELLLHGSPDDVVAESQRILDSGVRPGRFILREGNNLAPGTPLENTEAMVRTAWETV